jgi:hypothetical protein
VADKHLTGHFRVVALCVAEVNNRPCDTVCHLVGVAWIHFFKHDFRFLWVMVVDSDNQMLNKGKECFLFWFSLA